MHSKRDSPVLASSLRQRVCAPEGAVTGALAVFSLLNTGHLIMNRVSVRNAFSLVKTEVFRICGLAKIT